jgi:ribonuclease P protein component
MRKTIPLKKNYEFARIYNRGRFFPGKYMVIYVRNNRSGANRLGITASKKIGGSVRRNRVKRLIRENYRFYEEYIPDGLDIVFAVRKTETDYGFAEIRKEMRFLLKKVRAFDEKKWEESER